MQQISCHGSNVHRWKKRQRDNGYLMVTAVFLLLAAVLVMTAVIQVTEAEITHTERLLQEER